MSNQTILRISRVSYSKVLSLVLPLTKTQEITRIQQGPDLCKPPCRNF